MSELSAAFLVIGNEILSGRTAEKNLPTLTALLNAHGLRLREARVVADVTADIVAAVNALRATHDYVFTSGGIGPTHDDITTDAIAAAFALPVHEDPPAAAKLAAFYRERDIPFTASRRRMARMPKTATMINSDFPGAPAYRIGNVFVCAGVPAIFKMMAEAAVQSLPRGQPRLSSALLLRCGESVFADALAQTAANHPAVEIGSYPRDDNGVFSCHVVFSGGDEEKLQQAREEFLRYVKTEKIDFQPL